jgi:uncharacterized protein YjgD (DUF1641 family)
MAQLTVLDEKLAEVLGLAQAAQQATKKVATLARKENERALVEMMVEMGHDARTVEDRCQQVADARAGARSAIKKEARETKTELLEFMKSYLRDAEALDGLEFLSMAEAGELAHWKILEKLNEKADDAQIAEAVKVALPLQEKHVRRVAAASLDLAADEEPDGSA